MPPVAPMLAKSVKEIPAGPGYLYEPKWDGFRCIVFRDGDEVELGSRNERPMTRYFPEVVEAVKAQLPQRCVVDAEIVVPNGDRLDFEALLQRIHPAESRVRLLAGTTPASLVAFDLLALGDQSLMQVPLARRRATLDEVLAGVKPPVHRTLVTDDADTARQWFASFEGAGLDGVVAKPVDAPYEPDKRTMLKIKHERTADCVVAGFRWHKTSTPEQPLLGSLLLGLHAEDGRLQHVGVVASFPMKRRAELIEDLAPWREHALDGHPWRDWAEAQAQFEGRMPGAQSRWNAKKDLSWEPLRAERVVEVRYDHMEGTRFRHTTQFVRWRDDREPRSCTYEQLEEPVSYDLAALLG
jgi:ATP-dependent DNA ligase